MARDRRGESGQALVGVLVMMLLLFAFAGAIAVGSSGLLRDQAVSMTDVETALTTQNAVAPAVAQAVARSSPPSSCSGFTVPVAALASYGAPSCQSISPVSPPAVLPLPVITPTCGMVKLPKGASDSVIWFSIRSASGEAAWVDNNDDRSAAGACTLGPQPSTCAASMPAITGAIMQVQMKSCDLSRTGLVLHVSGQLPLTVRIADEGAGAVPGEWLVDLVVPAGSLTFRELDVLAGSGGPSAIAWEGPL